MKLVGEGMTGNVFIESGSEIIKAVQLFPGYRHIADPLLYCRTILSISSVISVL